MFRLWFSLLVMTTASACSRGSSTIPAAGTPASPGISATAVSVMAAPPDGSADAGATLPVADAQAAETPGANAAAALEREAGSDADAAPPPEPLDEEAWCPPEIETLPGPICAVVPQTQGARPVRTLVVFLHGVTNVGSGWQIALIQGMARYARQHEFALLAPRAPRQPHVERHGDVYAWKTRNLSAEREGTLLDSWMQAKSVLEQRLGMPFDHVFVMGFSSGAYYASTLALRGRLNVNGYAVFAGGSSPYSRRALAGVTTRVPIFVGYGLRDRAARRDAQGLVRALRAARWKHRVMAAPGAGHTITTRQFASALRFLRAEATNEAP
jgi:predicted esterase